MAPVLQMGQLRLGDVKWPPWGPIAKCQARPHTQFIPGQNSQLSSLTLYPLEQNLSLHHKPMGFLCDRVELGWIRRFQLPGAGHRRRGC